MCCNDHGVEAVTLITLTHLIIIFKDYSPDTEDRL